MNVGLLIITHDGIGKALLKSAESAYGGCPMPCQVMTSERSADPNEVFAAARRHLEELQQGDGVLVLTDVFGATPCNIAARLLNLPNVALVAGLNLGMLMKVFNYADLPLDKIIEKAVSGGLDSVFEVIPGMVPYGD
jgi:PTS system mannose-specific IIA component